MWSKTKIFLVEVEYCNDLLEKSETNIINLQIRRDYHLQRVLALFGHRCRDTFLVRSFYLASITLSIDCRRSRRISLSRIYCHLRTIHRSSLSWRRCIGRSRAFYHFANRRYTYLLFPFSKHLSLISYL